MGSCVLITGVGLVPSLPFVIALQGDIVTPTDCTENLLTQHHDYSRRG